MEEWGEVHERLKAEMAQVKEQMSQMMEALLTIKNTVASQNEVAQST